MSHGYDKICISATERTKSISNPKSRSGHLLNPGSRYLTQPTTPRNTEIIVLESEPALILEKNTITKMEKTSKILQRDEQIKRAAEAVMQSRDPNYKARYAKQEYYQKQRGQDLPHIEVLEVDGNVLLGIPATSTAQQFATFMRGGHRKQIVIATHDPKHKPARRVAGAMRPTETDATVMKSGVAALGRQLAQLREAIAATRTEHNLFNSARPAWSVVARPDTGQ